VAGPKSATKLDTVLSVRRPAEMPTEARQTRRIAVVGVATLLGGVGLIATSLAATAAPPRANQPAHHRHHQQHVLYASPSAKPNRGGSSCGKARFVTIGAAVAAAKPGGTVVACPGTYTEDVVIQKPLTLISRSATINAAGLGGAPIGAVLGQKPYNGITIEASNVTVKGFKVEGAEGEGILALNPNPVAGPMVGGMQLFTGKPLTKVTIEGNIVEGNDVGFGDPSSPYFSCTPNGGEDCGEGIHLMSVAHSAVINNVSKDNSGGILLTDEFGPNHDNLVQGNIVEDNVKDCGITIPSHNLGMNPSTGKLEPSFGGVYRNRIIGNVVTGNGVKGFGAGVGVFAPSSFTASYDNVIADNFIEGNGLAGISVHSHQANAYVNGNVFVHNIIGENNVSLADGTDSTPTDNQTTGILIWSDATPYHFVVAHNTIFDDTYGVWLTPSTVHATGLGSNHIIGATTPVFEAS
jgi:nitrous oxidase accessory protein NosD